MPKENGLMSVVKEVIEETIERLHLHKALSVFSTARAFLFDFHRLVDAIKKSQYDEIAKPITYFFFAAGFATLAFTIFGEESDEMHGVKGKLYEEFLPVIFLTILLFPESIGLHFSLGKKRTSLREAIYLTCYNLGTGLLFIAAAAPFMLGKENYAVGVGVILGLFFLAIAVRSFQITMACFEIGFWSLFVRRVPASAVSFFLTALLIFIIGGISSFVA
jgi:hypothetical protein